MPLQHRSNKDDLSCQFTTWSARENVTKVSDDALIDFAEAKNESGKNKKQVHPKAEECSLSQTQHCLISQCCDNFGFHFLKQHLPPV